MCAAIGKGPSLESPQDKGRTYETNFGRTLGVDPQPGSGNQWFAPMDIADGKIMWSCKWTSKKSFSISPALFKEVEDHIKGGSEIPGLATEIDGEEFVTLRAEDFRRLLASDEYKYIVPSKAEQKRSRSKIPSLFRDEEG